MSRHKILPAAAVIPIAGVASGAPMSAGAEEPAVYLAMLVAVGGLLAALLFAFWRVGWLGGRIDRRRRFYTRW